ncbi:MAG: ornithine--oxo-acid transaminase [Pseudonocardiales bacterium]|nr:ornithine--oxo-acid transaminase [Pseudonocardiales bacterium]
MTSTLSPIELERHYGARNYDPLAVTLERGEGVWLFDTAGRRYLDMMSAYSAVSFGHGHPVLLQALTEQAQRLAITSRAFHTDKLGPFLQRLCRMTGMARALPMNSGAEAVESAIKVARKWAYQVKRVPEGTAEIIVAGSNFHGRTTTIVSFSTDETARNDFGPFTPGFKVVKYGNLDEIESAITPRTAAILIEPIQGEAGVVVPPAGYLPGIRRLCDEHNVLMIADEIQSGLGRTGDLFALDHEGVRADLYTLGKALGGGILPVSAVVGSRAVLGVLKPGEHGSTFGGNPLACAVGRAVVRLLETGEYQERSRELGAYLHSSLGALVGSGIAEVRGRGLWAGVEISPGGPVGRAASESLAARGVLCKETQATTLRVAPPLVITRDEIDLGVQAIAEVVRPV